MYNTLLNVLMYQSFRREKASVQLLLLYVMPLAQEHRRRIFESQNFWFFKGVIVYKYIFLLRYNINIQYNITCILIITFKLF